MSNSVSNSVLASGLETLAAVSLLIILVLVLRRPVARWLGAQAAYALWALPALRLITPALPASWSPVSLSLPVSGLRPEPSAAADPVLELVSGQTPLLMTTDPVTGLPLPPPEMIAAAPVTEQALVINWPLVALAIWLSGALAYIAHLVWRQRQFTRTVAREALPAPSRLQFQAEEISAQIGLKQTPLVTMSLISKCPMVTGMARPIVILPAWFEEDYADEDQYAALLHELTHLKRRDLLALAAAEIFVAAQWFNPLAHYALRLFRVDQEAACDEMVLARKGLSPHSYAATLVKAARLSNPVSYPALAAGLPPTHHLKERLTRMKSPVPTSPARRVGISVMVLTGAAALFISACTTAAEDTDVAVKRDMHVSKNSFYIDGKEITDRRFVILSDPFRDISPRLEQLEEIEFEVPDVEIDMAELEAEMEKLEHEMSLIEVRIPAPPSPVSPEIIEEKVEGGTKITIPQQEFFIPDTEEVERMAEEMALKSELISRHAEKIAKVHEKRAAKLEARISKIMTVEFEQDIEEASEIISGLADRCADETFASGPHVILSAQNGKNETFRALCVQGDAHALQSTETEQFVNQSDLTEDERARFYNDRDSVIEFRR